MCSNYRLIRNLYNVRVGNEKNKYINNKINNTKDQKQIKNLVQKTEQSEIIIVIFNDKEYYDDKKIGANWHNYFIMVDKRIDCR